MRAALLVILVLLLPSVCHAKHKKDHKHKHTLGTIFGPSAEDQGGPLACTLGKRAKGATGEAARLAAEGMFVAAQEATLPCWAVLEIWVPRTGKTARVTVADRLPPKKWRSKRDLDLWHLLAEKLGHNGLERIEWFRVEPIAVPNS